MSLRASTEHEKKPSMLHNSNYLLFFYVELDSDTSCTIQVPGNVRIDPLLPSVASYIPDSSLSLFLIPTVLGRVVRLNLPVRHVGQIRQTKSQSQKRSDSPVCWAKFTRGLERSTSLSFEQFAIWAKVLVKSALIEVFSSLECIRAIQSCKRTTSHSCGEGSRCIRSPFRKTIRAIRVLDRSGSRHPILAVRFRLFPLNERLLKWLKYIPCMTTMSGEGQLGQFASLGNIL